MVRRVEEGEEGRKEMEVKVERMREMLEGKRKELVEAQLEMERLAKENYHIKL